MGLKNKLNNFELNLIPFYFLNNFSNKSKYKQGIKMFLFNFYIIKYVPETRKVQMLKMVYFVIKG